jgi:hypothetical protein
MNCPAFAKACAACGVIPLYGLEATTAEEVHVLCLFGGLEAALAFGDYAYSLITPMENDPEKTGDQVYVDEDDNILGELEYFLPGALSLSLEDIGGKVQSYGGLLIPAHIDRPAFSMTSQLGVVSPGPWAALECVRIPPKYPSGTPLAGRNIDTLGFRLTTSSDAHYSEHVGRRPFDLAISAEELQPGGPGADVDLAAFVRGLPGPKENRR